MAKNDDVILRGKALKDLRGIKDVLLAQGDPFLANIMNRAIECIENQPAVPAVQIEHTCPPQYVEVKECPCDGCTAKPCGHPARCLKFTLWLNGDRRPQHGD
jgi:hypothetical protein